MNTSSSTRRVLIVDTAGGVASRIVPWILEEEGHDVQIVREVGQAEHAATSFEPEVVIFDPDQNAPDVVRKTVDTLRRVAPVARIIGLAPAPGAEGALAGADVIERMPFDASDLLKRVAGD